MQSAREIYQDHLDRVSRAVWTSDFDAVAKEMAYPHQISSFDTDVEIATPAQLVENMRHFRETMISLGAKEYHRICQSAHFSEDRTQIQGQHATYILRSGTYATEPYLNEMILVLRNGIWLGAGILSKVESRRVSINVRKSATTRDNSGSGEEAE